MFRNTRHCFLDKIVSVNIFFFSDKQYLSFLLYVHWSKYFFINTQIRNFWIEIKTVDHVLTSKKTEGKSVFRTSCIFFFNSFFFWTCFILLYPIFLPSIS